MNRPKPVMLLILDGWGYREAAPDNAISVATTPNWDALLAQHPHTLIETSGVHVGLPAGQMGNSEVGHMNLGAGRIVYQDLSRIDHAIETGEFFRNPALLGACAKVREAHRTLHVFGLLSPGGVHSHELHLLAMLDLAKQQGVQQLCVHAFLDGRDTPPRSAEPSIRLMQKQCDALGYRIGTVSGRYYAMDRDQRWDRVQRTYVAIVDAQGEPADCALAALQSAYARGENDEFAQPSVIAGHVPMVDGDAVVFMNFRADRARELTAAFVTPDFNGFERRLPALADYVCLTEYAADLPATVAWPSETLQNTLPQVLSANGLSQLRIAETEKYAHVTFFFSGGVEAEYPGETRILVPSPKVATYDLQPEMSCPEVTDKLVEAITGQTFDVIICNIANPDMVGHTGVMAAAVAAAEAVDLALGRIVAAIRAVDGALIVTADHGNLEKMRDAESGQPHTAHTVGPVPLVFVGAATSVRSGGALRDVAPTMLHLLGVPVPTEMTGRNLLQDTPDA